MNYDNLIIFGVIICIFAIISACMLLVNLVLTVIGVNKYIKSGRNFTSKEKNLDKTYMYYRVAASISHYLGNRYNH